MGGTCSMHWGKGEVRHFGGETTTMRTDSGLVLQWMLHWIRRYGLDSSDSVQDWVARFCEHDRKLLGYVKREFFYKFNDYQILVKSLYRKV